MSTLSDSHKVEYCATVRMNQQLYAVMWTDRSQCSGCDGGLPSEYLAKEKGRAVTNGNLSLGAGHALLPTGWGSVGKEECGGTYHPCISGTNLT